MGKKVILVTGANKGIGLAIVETLLQQLPDALVLLGSRDASMGDMSSISTLLSTILNLLYLSLPFSLLIASP